MTVGEQAVNLVSGRGEPSGLQNTESAVTLDMAATFARFATVAQEVEFASEQ
jgi:hypothetical protein